MIDAGKITFYSKTLNQNHHLIRRMFICHLIRPFQRLDLLVSKACIIVWSKFCHTISLIKCQTSEMLQANVVRKLQQTVSPSLTVIGLQRFFRMKVETS